MKKPLAQTLTACIIALVCATTATAATPPSEEALSLIEELGLSEAPTPMSKHPGWNPQRVAVLLIPMMGHTAPGYLEELQKAAGDVELLFTGPGIGGLSKESLATLDGMIGFCTPKSFDQVGPDLRWFHSYAVGLDQCSDVSASRIKDVVFTNNKRLSGPGIAEHALAMLLALTHNLPAYHEAQSQGKFKRMLAKDARFGELKGKTILVVGLGGIGTEIAWRSHGLGMRVIATRRSSREGPDFVEQVGLPGDLHTLAGQADVVVNALPLTPETRGLFNKSFFDAVRPGAIFLSVGRGKSTVTDDLVAALESGQLYGAGLDVTDPEPLPPGSPLWKMPNVIITPHIAAAGPDSQRRTRIIAAENLRRYVAGEPMLNVVNISRGY